MEPSSALNSKFDHARYSGLAGNFSKMKSRASCSQGNREGATAVQFLVFGVSIAFDLGWGRTLACGHFLSNE